MSGVEEYEKMKVAELKRELKAAGLSGEGKKSELVQRLAEHRRTEQKLLGAAATDDVDDASLEALEANVLGEDLQPPTAKAAAPTPAKKAAAAPATKKAPVAPAAKPTPAKAKATPPAPVTAPKDATAAAPAPVTTAKVRISIGGESKEAEEAKSPVAAGTETKLARAKKFGLPESSALSADEKKAARSARFGTSSGDKPTGKDVTASAPPVDKDKLKSRAERFGLVVSEATGQALNVPAGLSAEKLKARQERFGVVSAEGKGTAATDERLKKRAARFGLDSAEVEEKKAKRAERFALKA